MRILYVDIDTLRPDHLGCYGYGRPTSPNIDELGRHGVRFEQLYASDSPCLPSRTALSRGCFGRRSGVVNHGGTRADPFADGRGRGRRRRGDDRTWPAVLRAAGLRTATISSFASRHSAWHWHAGFDETVDPGGDGGETADLVFGIAADWLRHNAGRGDWFLHVHLWDPHTPYRTPAGHGDPLAGIPAAGWIDDAEIDRQQAATGPHSAQEPRGWTSFPPRRWMPSSIRSSQEVRAVFDGYDTGIHYADAHVGRLMDLLADLGIEDETAVLVSSDHGESLGELGIWSDHQTADVTTHRIPAVLRWPGMSPGRDDALRYQFDLAATIAELSGARVPAGWDGRSFARSAQSPFSAGREELILSCAAWTVQRSVRFGPWLCIFTMHDGFHGFPEVMLFDVERDPHQRDDLAGDRPGVVADARQRVEAWQSRVRPHLAGAIDPLLTVLEEGGGFYVRDRRDEYLKRLRDTGRSASAAALASRAEPFGRL